MDGIINLYKPKGYTSHDAVARIKRICETRRVGHAGTLDPMAQGVLPILVGRAAGAQEYLMNHDKSYRAGMRFGLVTDTGDVTGNTLSEKTVSLSEDEVMASARNFIGKISQVPPMYSAIKIDGKKLYELAREGITVERKAREIEIYGIELVSAESGRDFLMDVSCSKGTYIRTLCEDIGASLGVGGALYSLERTRCGAFLKENAVALDELVSVYENEGAKGIEKYLISPETVFCDCRKIKLSDFYSRLCRNGCEIYLKKLGIRESDMYEGELIRLYDARGFFAIGKIGTFRDGVAVKAAVRFRD